MNAIWVMDYDMHTDKCYNTLGCPKCNDPIGKCEDGEFRCFNCGKVVFVKDKTMLSWYNKRSETKTEYEDCFPEEVEMKNGEVVKMGCGGKGTVRVIYRRNPVTMEWQTAYGECTKCGLKFMV